ncbi:MAG: DegT/DnrJ/EryC1/StrS family aminotransferase [Candidatus Mucispirillum faecigallinarum]|nr:DegT/DnrJ/EryC1/StrS family aminotransferase [Mucispirillum sp.]MDY5049890.1 DegT/DnrJ/EryC1/StrS family aminotransferase [Candidatus Mucispirillum faecigallinarum]
MSRQIPFADLKSQYNAYKSEIDKAVLDVMGSSMYIMGPEVEKLEKNLAAYVGAKHALSVSSGTDALLLALMSYGIKAGDEVITTPFTFIATAEVIALVGAKPVFADIDETTYNLDIEKVKPLINEKTKAIIPVSLYGLPADMDKFAELVKGTNIKLIEDACQSFGATDKGKYSCNYNSMGCTSFFPSKPLGCYGDGGAVFTNDDKEAEMLSYLRNHGQIARYKHKYIGINGRLDAMQAAILNVKLAHFKEEIATRINIGNNYTAKIKAAYKGDKADIITPFIPEGKVSVYAQYSVRVKNREEVAKKLNEQGIPTAIHYPIPLHMQECYAGCGFKEGDLPVSEKVSKEIMSLPMSAFLKEDDQDFIVDALCKAVAETK